MSEPLMGSGRKIRAQQASLPSGDFRETGRPAGPRHVGDVLLGRLHQVRHKYPSLPFPKTMSIEPTNACNLRCVMCPMTYAQEQARGMMDWDLFTQIADEARRHRVTIWSQVGGEPLLHPRLDDMVRYYKQPPSQVKSVSFSTNGMFLTPEWSRRLVDAKLDRLLVCVDGATAEVYESYRVRGDYERVVANARRFLEVRRSMGAELPRLKVQLIAMNDTREQIQAFLDEWGRWLQPQDKAEIKAVEDWAGQVPDYGLLPTYNNVSFKKWETTMPEADTRRHRINYAYKVPCWRFLYSDMCIHWNGNVSVCGLDLKEKDVLANVRGRTLADVWNTEVRAVQEEHRRLDFTRRPLCQRCLGSTRHLALG